MTVAVSSERLRRPQIRSRQEKKFASLLQRVLGGNAFYQEKLRELDFPARRPVGLSDLTNLPLTTRAELVTDQHAHPPLGTNLTYAPSRYTRQHRSPRGDDGPLCWLDTQESWQWWLECWIETYRAADVQAEDRIVVASAFDTSIGAWAAFEAGQALGALVIPGGGADVGAQAGLIRSTGATVLVAAPDRAAEIAQAARADASERNGPAVRTVLGCAEPRVCGRSLRSRIEKGWGGARYHDVALATEIGVWGFECGRRRALHVNEVEFVVEAIDPETLLPAEPEKDGRLRGELVLTNLGRAGSPVIRYRTGEPVELTRGRCPCGRDTVMARITTTAHASSSPEPRGRSATRLRAGRRRRRPTNPPKQRAS